MTSPFQFLNGSFKASLQDVDSVCLRLRALMADRLLASRDVFAVELLTREALTNAVRYGPEGGHVTLRFRLGCRAAVLSVDDEGPGFDWRAYLARPEDDEATGGRGLRIYRA